MLKELTKEQKDLKKVIKDKWIAQLTSQKIDKEKIREGVEWMYQIAKIQKPKVIILRSPLEIQLGANLLNKQEMRQEVEQEVWQEVWQEVEQEVRQEVEQEVWQEVWQEVEQEVRREVEQEVERDKKLKVFNFGYYLSAWYYDWFSFSDFFTEIGVLKNEKFNRMKELMLAGIYETIQLDGYCFVSLPPISVRKSNNRLHSDHFPAVKFADGYSVYALHGVRFPKELWTKVVSREMPMEEILKIVDIDQRVQAMKYAKNGIRDFYKSQNGKCVDSLDKLDIEARHVHYELWEIPKGEIFTQTVFFALYDCPSAQAKGEVREYAKGVPACKTVAEAMSWGMSSDDNVISPENWKLLIPLIHES